MVVQMVGEHLHVKQAQSMAHAVVGALHAPNASVAAIGRAAACRRGKSDKSGIKQFDRLLSNDKIPTHRAFDWYVRAVVGGRAEIEASIDWSDYAYSGHSKVCISTCTTHGRAVALVWLTVPTHGLKKRRAYYELQVLRMLKWALPESVRVTILADRGFGDTELYRHLQTLLGFDFVIRFRACIHVTAADGQTRSAGEWVASNGRAVRLDGARVTRHHFPVAAVVTVKRKGMRDSWCLATSRGDDAEKIEQLYSKRFQIEETFSDHKDWRFGLALAHMRIKEPARRDQDAPGARHRDLHRDVARQGRRKARARPPSSREYVATAHAFAVPSGPRVPPGRRVFGRRQSARSLLQAPATSRELRRRSRYEMRGFVRNRGATPYVSIVNHDTGGNALVDGDFWVFWGSSPTLYEVGCAAIQNLDRQEIRTRPGYMH